MAYSDNARRTISSLTTGDRIRVRSNPTKDPEAALRSLYVPTRTGVKRGVVEAKVLTSWPAVTGWREKVVTLELADGTTVSTILSAGSTVEVVQ